MGAHGHWPQDGGFAFNLWCCLLETIAINIKAVILTNHPNHPPTARPSYFPLQLPSQPAYYLLLIILELQSNKKCQWDCLGLPTQTRRIKNK